MNITEPLQGFIGNAEIWLEQYGFQLNSREWATLSWLALLALWLLSKAKVRESLAQVLRSAFSPKLLAVWASFILWIVFFIVLVDRAGVWNRTLTKDSLVWTVTAGLVSLAGFTEAAQPGYFRRKALAAVGVAAVFEYFVTLVTFSFLIEFLLQPIVLFFAVAPILSESSVDRASWQQRSGRFFLILISVLVVRTVWTLMNTWRIINWDALVLRAVWPMALALWTLVLVFVWATVASYEQAFLRLRARNETSGGWKAKLGLMLALRLQLEWIHDAAKGGTYPVARARSVREAFQAASKFRADRLAEQRREQEYQDNLRRYAGSTAVDEDGRPLDKREFRETIRALEWLHTCQMGWYRRDPLGYKSDLIQRFGDDFTRQGLPIPSGIQMFVSEDGQRWYAWRRTVGGHHFAIGASEGPPNQWLYDGTEPPQDFPGLGPEWGGRPFMDDHAPNWYE